jgi:hypothetical protein
VSVVFVRNGRRDDSGGYPAVTRRPKRPILLRDLNLLRWFGSKRPVAPNPGDRNVGKWLSLVERPVQDREAAGSNPAFPDHLTAPRLARPVNYETRRILAGFFAYGPSPSDSRLSRGVESPVRPRDATLHVDSDLERRENAPEKRRFQEYRGAAGCGRLSNR